MSARRTVLSCRLPSAHKPSHGLDEPARPPRPRHRGGLFIRSQPVKTGLARKFSSEPRRNGCFLLTCARQMPNSEVGMDASDSPECRSERTQTCNKEGRSMDRGLVQVTRSPSRTARRCKIPLPSTKENGARLATCFAPSRTRTATASVRRHDPNARALRAALLKPVAGPSKLVRGKGSPARGHVAEPAAIAAVRLPRVPCQRYERSSDQ